MKLNFASVALAAALAVQPAMAGQDVRPPERNHHRSADDGSALALGIIGVTAGFVIGSAIAGGGSPATAIAPQPPRDWRVPPYGRNFPSAYRPTTVEPWTREWYRECRDAYATFNPARGTYRGYDGRERFCVIETYWQPRHWH